MRKILLKHITVWLFAALLSLSLTTGGLAAEAPGRDTAFPTGRISPGIPLPETWRDPAEFQTLSELPSSFNSTPWNSPFSTVVQMQRFDNCWAYGSICAMEQSAIRNIEDLPGGGDDGTGRNAFNLDETQVSAALLDFNLGSSNKYLLSNLRYGGFGAGSAYGFIRKTSPVPEAGAPVQEDVYSAKSQEKLFRCINLGRESVSVNVAGVRIFSSSIDNLEEMKRFLLSCGGISLGICSSNPGKFTGQTAYCFYSAEDFDQDHEVCIVGWDDSFPKESFTYTTSSGDTHTPEQDGAFLFKNSWGSSWGRNGYGYLSYEDVPAFGSSDSSILSGGSHVNESVVFEAEKPRPFDRTYESLADVSSTSFSSYSSAEYVSARFTAETTWKDPDTQLLSRAAFWTMEPGPYTVEIRQVTDRRLADPDQPDLLSSQDFTAENAGYVTVDLDSPPTLEAGETFAVIFYRKDRSPFKYEYKGFTHNGQYMDKKICQAFAFDLGSGSGDPPPEEESGSGSSGKIPAGSPEPVTDLSHAGIRPVQTEKGLIFRLYDTETNGQEVLIPKTSYSLTCLPDPKTGFLTVKAVPAPGLTGTVKASFDPRSLDLNGFTLVSAVKQKLALGKLLNPEGKKVRFISSDKKTAAISRKGLLRVKKAGRAQISVMDRETAETLCTIILEAEKPDLGDAYAEAADNQTLDAKTFVTGTALMPDCWKSSNPSVAVIDPDTGILSVKKKGRTVVTAFYGKLGASGKYAGYAAKYKKTLRFYEY